MLSEVITAQNDLGIRISHIVLMGTGEPLDNYDNVMKFLSLVTDENGLNISMRHISLSTCGIVPRIYDLAEKDLGLLCRFRFTHRTTVSVRALCR